MSPLQPATGPANDRAITAARAVAIGVIEDLDMGRLAPGQRLVEADLCLRYGVGRGAVREALQRLETEGVVEISRNKGARICETTLADAMRTLEVTELMVGLAARGAAGRMDDPEAARAVRDTLAELTAAEALDDDRAFITARRHFYGTLVRLGGNRELQRIFPTIQVHVMRAQFQLTRIQRRLSADYHETGAAVLSGDAVAAEEAARVHVRRIRAALAASIRTEKI